MSWVRGDCEMVSFHWLHTVIPILTGHMWFLTSCHLWANFLLKFHLDLCKVIFRQKICKSCLILCCPMYKTPKNRVMLKTKAHENVPSSLEWLICTYTNFTIFLLFLQINTNTWYFCTIVETLIIVWKDQLCFGVAYQKHTWFWYRAMQNNMSVQEDPIT